MSMKTTTAVIAAGAMAAALGMVVQKASAEDEAAAATEKCYGVAKAGMNDCAGGNHGCAGMATEDGDPTTYINLPAGLCEKLVGGSLEPTET
jgi:uncharacterized membrane protein